MNLYYIAAGIAAAAAVGGGVYLYMKMDKPAGRRSNENPPVDTYNTFTAATPGGAPSAGIADPVSLRRNSEFLSVVERFSQPRTGLDRIGEYASPTGSGRTDVYEGQSIDDLRGYADAGGARFG